VLGTSAITGARFVSVIMWSRWVVQRAVAPRSAMCALPIQPLISQNANGGIT
jgi:hypothetical protein